MNGLFPQRVFTGFGATAFDPDPQPLLHRVEGSRPATLRRRLRSLCPQAPGVYGMVDADGLLVYVGKAKKLRTRLLSYFRGRSRDPRAGRILARARTIVWECGPSEFAALLRELELIARFRPRYNVHGQPHRRRRTYVCLGRRPAPYAFLSSRPAAGVAAFGPVSGVGLAREAVRRLNDWFGLRDCPQKQVMCFAEEAELFPAERAAGCIRHEIGTCLGPCAGACSHDAYRSAVRAARDFLAGVSTGPLDAIDAEMARAVAAQAYERAAAMRDKRSALSWLRGQLDRLREARERHSFIYPVTGREERVLWYLIHGGRVEGVVAAPAHDAARAAAAQAVDAVYHSPRPRRARAAEEIDAVFLVSSWFRRYPAEKARTLMPADALTALSAKC